jgi:hypothetical protein
MMVLSMYEWIQGRPPLILRENDLARWRGGTLPAQRDRFAVVRELGGVQVLMLRDPELTTVVPLELGGVLLVTAVYCDDDASITSHLDVLPVSGWEMLPDRFRSDGGGYVLFDGSLSGNDLSDPRKQQEILEQHGGMLQFALAPGQYEVETFGPWNPDERTELWLTRLVRAA